MVSDEERRNLYEALERRLGAGPATTMMELLPPVGWSDLARRSDLAPVRGEMAGVRGEMAEVRGEMAEVRGEMAEVRGEMATLRAELKGEMVELRAEVKAQLPRLIGANVGMAFATAGLVLAAAKLA